MVIEKTFKITLKNRAFCELLANGKMDLKLTPAQFW